MRVVERVLKPAPAAFHSPGGWAVSVEDDALGRRLELLTGWSTPWCFIERTEIRFDRATNTVEIAYHVPLVLPIKGVADAH